ncbi:phosphonate ABC transporter, permease protein PhnE [Halodurantibacterium flavum]|uniref:Phosphonate ABC transporter, permease protein PhnE n=1 Tax=Halodurantibacterium flavum TaxID=1382802 RepID=A0ABW4S4D0_9RHOB
MALTETAIAAPDLRQSADRLFRRKRFFSFGLPALVLLYLTYIFFAFDVAGLAQRARLDNARILVADSYSHKVHVVQDARSGNISVAIEGEVKGAYPAGTAPDWVELQGQGAGIDLGRGQSAIIADGIVRITLPDGGVIEAEPTREGVRAILPDLNPAQVNQSDQRLVVFLDGARLIVTRTKIELFRYFFGWEMFWFSIDSPFYGRSLSEIASLAVSDERVVPQRSNIAAMAHDFWYNRVWRHGDVYWALGETVLMAFFGTFGAALVALPLAFLAARNFSPSAPARFGIRRLFDFVRGVDGLIWTIILARAFGPGPMTGALAMLVTDTGSFGKMFSEALENTDKKQVEGIRSTGANAMQRYRFGVIPQVMPVLLSQMLYFFESNTRSATIIGAIVGGGIGLFITQAINTQKDWEQVSYYIVLIILMVMVMDTVSGWLRRRLITGDGSGH